MILSLAAGCVTVLVACGGSQRAETGSRLEIAASTPLVAEIVEMAGAESCAELQVLLEAGTSPHETEASPRVAELAANADLLVRVGMGFEHATTAAPGEGRVLDLAETVQLVEAPSGPDPHFWQDPSRVAQAVEALADKLVELLGCDQETVGSTTSRSVARLEELAEDTRRLFEDIPSSRRRLVTFHDSLRTFAERFDFEIVETVAPGISHESEPSPGHLERVATALAEMERPVVVVEEFDDRKLVEAVVRQSGRRVEVVVVTMDNLPADFRDEDDTGEGYFELFENTTREIHDALD